jgi:hypothetical protein
MSKPFILFITVATGSNECRESARRLIESMNEHFLFAYDIMVLTDKPGSFDAINVYQEHLGWPRVTLMRYHNILSQKHLIGWYDYVFYIDADMQIASSIIEKEFLSDGLTAVLHPGFVSTFERNPESAAYVEGYPTYYQGCLIGGVIAEFEKMCESIAKGVDSDDEKGIVAIWHDESHLNRYLADHPPAKTLTPAYCYPSPHYLKHPESWMECDIKDFIPKIRHDEKIDSRPWR